MGQQHYPKPRRMERRFLSANVVAESVVKPGAAKLLRGYFRRNGYVREANAERKREEANVYKKGCEVRIVLENEREVGEVARALKTVDLTPGKVFLKHRRPVVPIYGTRAVAWFKGPS